MRGKRGSLVPAYPAVQYGFTPDVLEVRDDDWVHIQLHGSDFTRPYNSNHGEGWRYSDRHNMVQVAAPGGVFPSVPAGGVDMFGDREGVNTRNLHKKLLQTAPNY